MLTAHDHPTGDKLPILRARAEGTASGTGRAFFQSRVRHLPAGFGVRYAFVADFAGNPRARILAYSFRDRLADNTAR
jgi:hypothetical protein